MSTLLRHRVEAVFWWRHLHAEDPPPTANLLHSTPVDDEVNDRFAYAQKKREQKDGESERYGTGADWSEFRPLSRFSR